MTTKGLVDEAMWRHPTAMIAIDRHRRVRFANHAALAMLDTEFSDVDGADLLLLFDGEAELARAISSAFADGEERRTTVAMHRGKRQADVTMTLTPFDEASESLAMMVSIRDIEKRRLIDDRVVQIERLASLGRLAAGFAHQLRNPLAAVSALVENMAAETPVEDPRHEYTSRIIGQVERIERLISTCLEFDLEPSIVRQRWKPASIACAALDSLEALRGASPRLIVAPDVWDVEVCGEQISECLRLLLENALDACPDVAKIEVIIEPQSTGGGRFVCFTVRDAGLGIPPAQLSLLFEPFYTTKAKGSGLGLTAAQALAIRNGGSLEARSMPGDTRFVLRLRAAAGQKVAP